MRRRRCLIFGGSFSPGILQDVFCVLFGAPSEKTLTLFLSRKSDGGDLERSVGLP